MIRSGASSSSGRATLRLAAQWGVGNVLSVVLMLYWTLALPRRLSVDAYAEWRFFVLYNSFVGVLHVGVLDAFLYRWSRRRARAHERPAALGGVVLHLVGWHVLVIAVWWLVSRALPLSPTTARVVWACLAYALVWNVATCLQYALQAARVFLPSALFVGLHAAGFAAIVASGTLNVASWFTPAIAYTTAAAVALLITLVPATRPWSGRVRSRWVSTLVMRAIPVGVPILVVNLLLIALVNADRITATWALSRAEFAIFAFAASLVAFANNLTMVASQFAVPFLTRWAHRNDGKFEQQYDVAMRLLFGLFAAAGAVGLAVHRLLSTWLPGYSGSLPIAAVMLVGVAFGAPVQVFHLPYARATGLRRRSLFVTLGALGVGALLLTLAGTRHSMLLIAGAGAAVLAIWWASNAAFIVPRTAARSRMHAAYAFGVTGLGAGAYLALTRGGVAEALVIAALAISAAGAALSIRRLNRDVVPLAEAAVA